MDSPSHRLPSAFGLLLLLAAAVGSARAEETLPERRQRMAAMSATQREQLMHRQTQFAAMDPDEQQRLRQLHAQLECDPAAPQLRQVMQHYSDWLKTLPPQRRDELLELEPAERIKRIKKLLLEHASRPARRLNEQDAAGLVRWMECYAAASEDHVLQSLPESRREQIQRMNPAMRRRVVIWSLGQRWQAAPPGGVPLNEDELADLRAHLSPASRERLKTKTPAEQWKTICGWIRTVFRQLATRHADDSLSMVAESDIAAFFEHDLTDEQRDRLLGMPGEDMHRELRRLYLARFSGIESPRPPGSGKKHGGGAKMFSPRKGEGRAAKSETRPEKPDAPGQKTKPRPEKYEAKQAR